MAQVQPDLEDLETKEGSAVVLGLCCGGGCGGGGTTGGSLSPDWATRSTQGICLLSLPTKELKIVDFPGSIPKDHDSAEADSFWSLDQVQNFCHFWGLPSKGLSPWTRLPSSLLQGDRPL